MEKELKELREKLYDTISGGYTEMNIGEFKIMAYEIISLKPIEKSTFIVVVCKIAGCDIFDYTKYIFHKQYDTNDKIKTGWFLKTKLADEIMKDLIPIVAISVLREEKLKKLGI